MWATFFFVSFWRHHVGQHVGQHVQLYVRHFFFVGHHAHLHVGHQVHLQNHLNRKLNLVQCPLTVKVKVESETICEQRVAETPSLPL